MDLATLLGVIIAFVSILAGMIMEGGDPMALINIPAFLIVVPSTIAVCMAGGYLKDVKQVFKAMNGAYTAKVHDPTHSIETLVKFAEKARREGLLALEEAVKEVDDPFIKRGIEMAIDGTDPEELREILEAEAYAKKQAAKVPVEFLMAAGGYAPTIGIIGTVLGLVHVLHNLSDAAALGPAISGAFIATLFGVASANLIYIPLANKLKRMAHEENHHNEAMIEGIAAIQAGSNPRIIQQKLSAILGVTEEDEKEKAA